jgi:hypothetical protein
MTEIIRRRVIASLSPAASTNIPTGLDGRDVALSGAPGVPLATLGDGRAATVNVSRVPENLDGGSLVAGDASRSSPLLSTGGEMYHFSKLGWASALNKIAPSAMTDSQKAFGRWGFEYGNGPGQSKFTGATLASLMPLVGTADGVKKYPKEPYFVDAYATREGKCIFTRSQLLENWECQALLQNAVAASKRAPQCVHPIERDEMKGILASAGTEARVEQLLDMVYACLASLPKLNSIRSLQKKHLTSSSTLEGIELDAVWKALKEHHTAFSTRTKAHRAAQKAAQPISGEGGDVIPDPVVEDIAHEDD